MQRARKKLPCADTRHFQNCMLSKNGNFGGVRYGYAEGTKMSIVKTSISLTREEAADIVARFQELLERPSITKIILFFDPDRFVTSNRWEHLPEAHSFIAVENDPIKS
jgi:hypothetical protein